MIYDSDAPICEVANIRTEIESLRADVASQMAEKDEEIARLKTKINQGEIQSTLLLSRLEIAELRMKDLEEKLNSSYVSNSIEEGLSELTQASDCTTPEISSKYCEQTMEKSAVPEPPSQQLLVESLIEAAPKAPIEPSPIETGPESPIETRPIGPSPIKTGPIEPSPIETGPESPIETRPIEPSPIETGTESPIETGPIEPSAESLTETPIGKQMVTISIVPGSTIQIDHIRKELDQGCTVQINCGQTSVLVIKDVVNESSTQVAALRSDQLIQKSMAESTGLLFEPPTGPESTPTESGSSKFFGPDMNIKPFIIPGSSCEMGNRIEAEIMKNKCQISAKSNIKTAEMRIKDLEEKLNSSYVSNPVEEGSSGLTQASDCTTPDISSKYSKQTMAESAVPEPPSQQLSVVSLFETESPIETEPIEALIETEPIEPIVEAEPVVTISLVPRSTIQIEHIRKELDKGCIFQINCGQASVLVIKSMAESTGPETTPTGSGSSKLFGPDMNIGPVIIPGSSCQMGSSFEEEKMKKMSEPEVKCQISAKSNIKPHLYKVY